MDLVFGTAGDGRVFPDFPGGGRGALGEAVVGPSGLMDVLETQLGLTRPRSSPAVRVAAYAAKARAACDAAPGRFFAASFDKDPWATARLLLGWRDDLVAAGWDGAPVGADRLDALAAVEASGPRLPAGAADRLLALLAALADRPQLEIRSLLLIQPEDRLPPPWRRLVGALAACGVEIRRRPDTVAADHDLGRVQAFLGGEPPAALVGDGAFVQVHADTALTAAEAVAEWIAAGGEEALEGTVVLCPDGDTALLDQALTARGLPALGASAASPWRGALQVLPLAFAVAWRPFNPKALLDLLLLPRPPVGRAAAGRLASALSREPGVGGPRWAKAWEQITADLQARLESEPKADEAVAARLARWREWTTGGLYDSAEGVPAAEARKICARVGRWALETDAGRGDPLLLSVSGAASALSDAIDALGHDRLPALLIDRMLDQVLADGAQNPQHVAQAGGLRVVGDPAGLWAPAPRVVWWGFAGPGARITPSPWSAAELAALAARGCRLETAAAAAARASWSYANAVRAASERLILVRPALAGADETTSHPLAHQLDPIVRPSGEAVSWKAEQLLERDVVELAGRRLERRQAQPATLPRPVARWSLPQGVVDRLEGRVESATTLERLADCQLRWLVLDVLRLSGGRFAEIPGTDQLLGTLAHELANRVLEPGPAADPAQIRADVEALFDEVLAAIAAPLRQPGLAGELAAARSRIPAALAQLADLLRARGYEVVGTEIDRSGEFEHGLSVRGRLDLLVGHPEHGAGVIDLKWAKSAKRRLGEIADGRALQLATYGAIADAEAPDAAPGAYYLLKQRRMIGEAGSPLVEEGVDTVRPLPATWRDLAATWRGWRDLAADGVAVSLGVEGAAEHVPPDLPVKAGETPCRYCELTRLCRVGAEEV